MDPKKRIDYLSDEIRAHQFYYYTQDQPVISDVAYDSMFKELEDLETEFPNFKQLNSPTNTVGYDLKREFSVRKHIVPMISIRTIIAKDTEGLKVFTSNCSKALDIENPEYIAELKYDGIALSLIYLDGFLIRAVTRGRNNVGEVITHNVSCTPSVLKNIKYPNTGIVEVRGELVVFKENLEVINHARNQFNVAGYADCRSAAGGIARSKKTSSFLSKQLTFMPYSLQHHTYPNLNKSTIKEHLDLLQSMGFRTFNEYILVTDSVDDIYEFYQTVDQHRSLIPLQIDGIVVKLNHLSHQKILGETVREPRWAAAYKFKPAVEMTEVVNFRHQLGRTGEFTPVAEVKPVIINGIEISSVNMHNYKKLKLYGINIGSTIEVGLCGDTIPGFMGLIKNKPEQLKPVTPTCHQLCESKSSVTIEYRESSGAYLCTGYYLCDQHRAVVLDFFLKQLGIKSITPGLLYTLVACGFCKEHPLSVFTFGSTIDLIETNWSEAWIAARLEMQCGVNQKRAEIIAEDIVKERQMPLSKFIFSLGLPNITEQTALLIAREVKEVDLFLTYAPERFTNIALYPRTHAHLLQFIKYNGDSIKRIIKAIRLEIKPF